MIKDNLKIIRKITGISQREVGRRIQMSGQYIAKIEKGERTPTIDTLTKIAAALNVELSELLERPNFTSEIFFYKIDKDLIAYSQLLSDCNLDTSRLKSALLNDSFYCLDDYYNVGICLGFSKGFLERRKNIDLEIRKIILPADYDKYISIMSKKYDTWSTNVFTQNISMEEMKKSVDKIFPLLEPQIAFLSDPKLEMVYNYSYNNLACYGYENLLIMAIEKTIKTTLSEIKEHEEKGDLFDGLGSWISKESPVYDMLKKSQENSKNVMDELVEKVKKEGE